MGVHYFRSQADACLFAVKHHLAFDMPEEPEEPEEQETPAAPATPEAHSRSVGRSGLEGGCVTFRPEACSIGASEQAHVCKHAPRSSRALSPGRGSAGRRGTAGEAVWGSWRFDDIWAWLEPR